MTKPYRIHGDVYLVGSPNMTSGDDCLVYVLDGGSEMALIDAGAGTSASDIENNITSLGLQPQNIKWLIATHGHIDHIGGLSHFRRRYNCQVVAHKNELSAIEQGLPHLTAAYYYGISYQPVPVDVVMEGKEMTLEVGKHTLHLVHTPGHTPGSIAGYTDLAGTRVLFGQDIHGPFDPSWGSDISQWKQSMLTLLDLRSDILCEGHFGIYRPRERAAKFIKSQLARYGHPGS